MASLPALTTLLTPNRVKLSTYEYDPDYLRAIEMMRGRWGVSGRIYDRLWNHAAILLRPDAIVGRCSRTILPALRAHGFVPVVARSVWMDSKQTTSFWQYQSNLSTAERLCLLDILMTSGSSIYIVLRDDSHRASAPATVHATYIKGPTVAAKRKRAHIRSLAGPPVANLLSYIHASDDPADLAREMAILFDPIIQTDILIEIDAQQDRTGEVLRLIADLEARLSGKFFESHSASTGKLGYAKEICELPESLFTPKRWRNFVRLAMNCKSFVTGETYDTSLAIVPDDKRLSLPLDAHLVRDDFGSPW